MPRYVALLRGVNVGRAKRVPMADWRALLETLGCEGVGTILNSGNDLAALSTDPSRLLVAFTSDAGSLATLAALLGRAGRDATTRNWATVLKIRDLLQGDATQAAGRF